MVDSAQAGAQGEVLPGGAHYPLSDGRSAVRLAGMARRAPIPQADVGDLRPLSPAELPQPTIALAKFLIGKVLVREDVGGRLTGRIVETEAYPPGDPACHAHSGRTARN